MTRKSHNLGVSFRIYVTLYPSVSVRGLSLNELSPLFAASARMTRVNVLRVAQTPEQLASFVSQLKDAPQDLRVELLVTMGSDSDE